MKISLIVAIGKNNGIGKDNNLLWHLPADMKFFKEKTMGHCIVTGRKNYESIPEKFRPLPGRTNIVMTRDKSYTAEHIVVVNNLEDAISFAESKNESELFIIGGGQIYREVMQKKLADKLYITHVDATPVADTFFEWNPNEWKKVLSEEFPADEKNKYDMVFAEYVLK